MGNQNLCERIGKRGSLSEKTRGKGDNATEEYLRDLLVDNFDSVKKSFDEADLDTQCKVLYLIDQEEFFDGSLQMEMHINSM